jgi:hypothetical protein
MLYFVFGDEENDVKTVTLQLFEKNNCTILDTKYYNDYLAKRLGFVDEDKTHSDYGITYQDFMDNYAEYLCSISDIGISYNLIIRDIFMLGNANIVVSCYKNEEYKILARILGGSCIFVTNQPTADHFNGWNLALKSTNTKDQNFRSFEIYERVFGRARRAVQVEKLLKPCRTPIIPESANKSILEKIIKANTFLFRK